MTRSAAEQTHDDYAETFRKYLQLKAERRFDEEAIAVTLAPSGLGQPLVFQIGIDGFQDAARADYFAQLRAVLGDMLSNVNLETNTVSFHGAPDALLRRAGLLDQPIYQAVISQARQPGC